MGAWVLLRGDRARRSRCATRTHRSIAHGAHRDDHADLQRRRRHRLRRPARHLRIAGRHRRAVSCSTSTCCPTLATPPLRAAELRAWQRLRPTLGDGAVDGGARMFYRWRRRRTQAQGRQRGRLLPPLGQQLPLHGGARRRQHRCAATRLVSLVRLMEAEPARRHRADAAARLRPRHRARPAAAVRQPRHRPPVRARHAVLAARRIALLGPQRHPARRSRSCAIAAGADPRPRRAGRRDPVARLRRSRADAPRRLRGLAGAAAAAAARSSSRPTCWKNCSATAAGARATCRTPA